MTLIKNCLLFSPSSLQQFNNRGAYSIAFTALEIGLVDFGAVFLFSTVSFKTEDAVPITENSDRMASVNDSISATRIVGFDDYIILF